MVEASRPDGSTKNSCHSRKSQGACQSFPCFHARQHQTSRSCDLDLAFALWTLDLLGWSATTSASRIFQICNPVQEACLVSRKIASTRRSPLWRVRGIIFGGVAYTDPTFSYAERGGAGRRRRAARLGCICGILVFRFGDRIVQQNSLRVFGYHGCREVFIWRGCLGWILSLTGR